MRGLDESERIGIARPARTLDNGSKRRGRSRQAGLLPDGERVARAVLTIARYIAIRDWDTLALLAAARHVPDPTCEAMIRLLLPLWSSSPLDQLPD